MKSRLSQQRTRLPKNGYLKLRRGGPFSIGSKGAQGYSRSQNRALLDEALNEMLEEEDAIASTPLERNQHD
jgi:hypothetical protein